MLKALKNTANLCLVYFCASTLLVCSSAAFLPHYTVDKVCAVGDNTISFRKTLESWIGKELPHSFFPGDAKLFTGFKIHRVYRFYNYFMRDGRTIKLSYCENGKVKFESEKIIDTDGDWSAPWCFFEDATSSDYSKFHCLKMARRKKYASQAFDFFLPYTWVAGIFYCDIKEEQKRAIKVQLTDSTRPHDYTNFCTLKNSIPIQPLFASNYKEAWTESTMKLSIPAPNFIKHFRSERFVPFLYTLSPTNILLNLTSIAEVANLDSDMNLRSFMRIPGSQDLLELYHFWKKEKGQHWYEEVRVDEAYTYNMLDRISLRNLAESFVVNAAPFLNKLNRKINNPGIGPIGGISNALVKPLWKHLKITEKLSLGNFSSFWEPGAARNNWEKVNISEEKVVYERIKG